MTLNLVPGEAVYGEKRISVEEPDKAKIEYRVWNPFRSKLAAAILGGVDKVHIAPGKKVLYLGAASGTSVSHVSDICGPVSSKVNHLVNPTNGLITQAFLGGTFRPKKLKTNKNSGFHQNLHISGSA